MVCAADPDTLSELHDPPSLSSASAAKLPSCCSAPRSAGSVTQAPAAERGWAPARPGDGKQNNAASSIARKFCAGEKDSRF